MNNLEKVEQIVRRLPEAVRVDVEAWDDEPTFRVRNKSFVFATPDGSKLSLKLSLAEAAAVVAVDRDVGRSGHGLGKHGWITVSVRSNASSRRWQELEEWIRTSYVLVAPAKLARIVLNEDANSAGTGRTGTSRRRR
jgi:predicted DNA-binding protein (MmcQ/YjbR family)